MTAKHTDAENRRVPDVNQKSVTSGPFRDGPSSFSQRVVDKRFPLVGRVPIDEALREGDSSAAANGLRDPGIAAGSRGPLRRAVARTFVAAVSFVFFIAGVLLVVFVLVVLAGYVLASVMWTLRAPLIGLAFAFVIAKIVGLL